MVSLEQGVFLLICSIHCVFIKQKKSKKKHNLLYFKFAKGSFQETHFAFLSRDERNENVLWQLDKHPVWHGSTVGQKSKIPPKINVKHSWNWLFMLAAVCQVLSVKRIKWLETDIMWICWNLLNSFSWNQIKWTYFWRVWAICNHCAAQTKVYVIPYEKMSAFSS